MNIQQIIYLLSSIVLASSSILFFIFIFGHNHSVVYSLSSWARWVIRFGFAITCTGAFWNCLYFIRYYDIVNIHSSTYSLVLGLAIVMAWSTYVHRVFVMPPEKKIKDNNT